MGARVAISGEHPDEGFSLVEILVVVVIISILAAIAVPIFLAQRERAYVAQSETSLKNAATAMESAAVEAGGDYSDITVQDLTQNQGLKYSRSVVILTIESGNGSGFCLSVLHRRSGETIYWDSGEGQPQDPSCRDLYR